ncbi:tripartite ATP-independent periplasmic transporter DctQ [Salinisphaera sp. PC39]|uniref:TRAP transporter small permease subunit n=1 Tax=Salinisphaera sp. PC39 TaxID=1304156 RepID=UPI0033426608
MRTAAAVLSALRAVNDALGRAVAWLTVAMVAGVVGVVILRHAFGIGATALQEAVLYLHALVFLVAAAHTLQHDGHVRVDILYRRWGERGRARVDLLGSLCLLLPMAVFVFVASLDYVAASWALLETSPSPDGLPFVYLLKTLIPVAAAQLAAAALVQAGDALRVLSRRE